MLSAALSSYTRDGLPSVAAKEEARALRVAEVVNVTAAELADWAAANGVDLRVAGSKLPVVNARRAALHLPLFRVVAPAVHQTKAAPPTPLIAETKAELLQLVHEFDGMRTGLLTPACATWLLELNQGNRPLERRAVARFVAIIERGEWVNTSEPIIISSAGLLNDGQHRLHAIVRAGKPVEVDIRFGVAREAFTATNTGARRTAAHTLHILGAKNCSATAGIARILLLYDRGQLGAKASRVVENSDVLKVVEDTPAIAVVAEFLNRSQFTPTKSSPFGFVVAAAARATLIERAMVFANAVRSGREPDGDPTRELHMRLLTLGMRQQKSNPIEVATLTTKAWNGWLTGKPTQVRFGKADLDAPFPQILGVDASND